MKRHFAVVETEQNNKWYAYIQPITSCDNIVNILKKIDNVASFTIYDTKKECENAVKFLIQYYKDNNKYLFENEPF